MKFKKYVDAIQKLLDENPQFANIDVVSASDEEGNSFSQVFYDPTFGNFIAEDGGSFVPLMDTEKHTDADIEKGDVCPPEDVNAICIN